MLHKLTLLIILCYLSAIGNAQELLTIEQAVSITLENNFDIKIAKNNTRIDEQNRSLGNAGILPRVTGNFTRNNSIQNSRQVRADGQVQELNNAKNDNMNYGVSLNWTIFDGFKMFAKYDQLKEIQKQGEAEVRYAILTQVSEIIATYYTLVQQQKMIRALDTAIDLSQYRLTMAQNRFEIGKAAKLEVLNAQVDLNADKTTLLQQQEQYANSKTYMNQLMARDLGITFRVEDSVAINDDLKLGELLGTAENQNPQIQLAVINKRISEYNLKQIKGERYPIISLNSGYNFNESHSSLGFATENKGRGFNYGVSASVNIFNGFLQNRNEKIAKIEIENSELQIGQQKQTIQSQITSLFQTYITNLDLVQLERSNEELAKENLDITFEKFKIGTITTLEVRTAQLNYINTMVRSYTAQYQAKLSEIRLKELAGNAF
ncbi:TolC family protein [Sphingobacterium sp. SYP-B4668]|uniref:TolC family protein n=1 Tax=Sphingobacterium sp. SYP-B4668 TaxID=2996035 RepID=UPI0022DD8760|nr:TolC family protein [Sphingobacterium sp. SYP-B4668]